MAITVEPQGAISLVKCPLEDDYKNTFTFSSLTQQFNYFSNLPDKMGIPGGDYTFIRKDGKIRVSITFEKIASYNYLYYVNRGFNIDETQTPAVDRSKRYYCFIDKVEYVNENCSDIYFHTDVFQTWYFQIVWNRCFVEREHVNSDNVGEHTIPEDVATGEYIQLADPTNLISFNSGEDICVCVSDFPTAEMRTNISNRPNINNGIFSGLYYCVFHPTSSNNFTTICGWVTEFLRMYDLSAKADAVVSIFMVPNEFIGNTFPETVIISGSGDNAHKFYLLPSTTTVNTLAASVSVSRPTSQGGSYTPHNKKLLVYPYQYLLVTNNSGIDVIFNYEDFVSNSPSFKIIGALTPGCSIRCVPLNYKKISDTSTSMKSFNYSVPGGKFPICAWNSDTYINWMTENGVSQTLALATGLGGIALAGSAIVTGGLSLALAGGLLGGVGSVFGALNNDYKHSLAPDQARGNSSVGDVTYSANKNTFTAYKMGIREEMAKVIDSYFDMFGYKVNSLKVPNITGRTYWNFIKTIDCNADGDIPQEDLKEIRKACDHGITFWHNTSYIYDYSQSNSIVT